MTAPRDWILPRDRAAELESLQAVRAIWGEEALVSYVVCAGSVVAEARSPRQYGSQLELSVRGANSGEAARRLARLLECYRGANKAAPHGISNPIWIVIKPGGERHHVELEPLEGIHEWAQGLNVTIAEYRFAGIVHSPPPEKNQ